MPAGRILQAWKAGAPPRTAAIAQATRGHARRRAVFAISIPESPYRCPARGRTNARAIVRELLQGPRKPRSKVLDPRCERRRDEQGAPCSRRPGAELYKGIVEYRPQHVATAVDAAQQHAQVRDPGQRGAPTCLKRAAADARPAPIAVQTGLANSKRARWCNVNFLTFESTVAPHVHVIGDSIQIAPLMPKKRPPWRAARRRVVAAAVVAELNGWEIDPDADADQPPATSFIDDKRTVHVASVHEYVAAERTFKTVAGFRWLVERAERARRQLRVETGARTIWADAARLKAERLPP